ncbi:hypothetical protein GCM10011378_41440 [Hymenobacter glacieicola]|uniref:Uncharacterized protein n=1 Tax=Hymenobacter glacieicola TaxID=1562124 RepID=A0ABQ1X5Q3_9BACT|nr:hypothetical protein GCM10011378_41440 [Hymenobacter glacieicola]
MQVERAKNPDGLLLTLPTYRDDVRELDYALRNGLEFNMESEALEPQHPECGLATVLAVPERLTDELAICAGPFSRTKGKFVRSDNGRSPFVESPIYSQEVAIPRTAADIRQTVRVGDEVFVGHLAFTDESELPGYPGLYRIPVSEVVYRRYKTNTLLLSNPPQPKYAIEPFGGYSLLRRVFTKPAERGGLLLEPTVIDNEGVVAYVGEPLGQQSFRLQPGQQVVFGSGHGTTYTIEGEELIAVRQDYVLAVREPQPAQQNAGVIEIANQLFKGPRPLTGLEYDVLTEVANREALKESKIPGML